MDVEDNTSADVTQIESESVSTLPPLSEDDLPANYSYAASTRSGRETPSTSEDATKSAVTTKTVSDVDILSEGDVKAIASVLESTIDQLAILGYTNDKPHINAKFEYRTLEEKYGEGSRPRRVYEIKLDESAQVVERREKLTKIQKDRSMLQNILEKTLHELLSKGTYQSLLEFISLETLSRNEEKQLVEDERKNTLKMNELKSKLQEGKFHQTAELVQLDERIAKLKDTIQDVILENEAEKVYVQKWEAAREEQHTTRIEMEERSLTEELNKLKFNIDTELRVHSEMENFLNQAKNKLTDDIDKWMDTYDREYEEWELKISKLKHKSELQRKQLEDLTLLYEQRAVEIQEYEEEKRKKEEHLAEQKFLNEKATKIQAWWRGTMVRRGLGPFKKKKKDKGKGKKGKGKK